MQINQYTAYSIVSSTENKNNEEIEKVFFLIKNFSEVRTISEAKKILQSLYQIKDPVQQFPLGANSFLDIKENAKKYSVKISYKDNDEKECIIYSYTK